MQAADFLGYDLLLDFVATHLGGFLAARTPDEIRRALRVSTLFSLLVPAPHAL